LASRYGPSTTDLALSLPTQSEMFNAGRNSGPKFIRHSQPVSYTNFNRPLMVPQSGNEDYWRGRPNRPRISSNYYDQQISAQQRVFGN
jgi:hypothetical protein